jgi:hypothetical protein
MSSDQTGFSYSSFKLAGPVTPCLYPNTFKLHLVMDAQVRLLLSGSLPAQHSTVGQQNSNRNQICSSADQHALSNWSNRHLW